MKGSYRGAELRAHMRREWAELVLPTMIEHETTPLARFVPNEDLVAIDIGANKGWWTSSLLKSFPGGVRHVYMIDASPENFRELTNHHDHLTLNSEELQRVSAYPYAMSNTHGTVTLFTSDDGSPLASVYKDVTRGWHHDEPPLSQEFVVPCDTIDAFMTRQQLDHVNIVKVDVEGHEMAVFEGAVKALSEKKIDVLQFEFGVHQIQARNFFVDFYDFFDSYGYKMWCVESGVLIEIPKYVFDYENLSRQYIMLAVAGR